MFQKLKKKGSQWGGIEKGGKGVKKNDVGLCVNGNSYECLVGLVVLKMDVQMEEELVGFVYLDNKTNHSYVTDNSVLKGLLCSFQLISFQLIRLLLLGYYWYILIIPIQHTLFHDEQMVFKLNIDVCQKFVLGAVSMSSFQTNFHFFSS
eukprot:TRINITY_DN7757_c0_g1_i10.p10 TRINITY_DN7757_c0_g1~~TRINITY_DN7757_c0_g1_i10.p10  ORF type:complete len:149 (+),score=13.92 TRINITY_DN7757_c0_g1_i10:1755-2201(+)